MKIIFKPYLFLYLLMPLLLIAILILTIDTAVTQPAIKAQPSTQVSSRNAETDPSIPGFTEPQLVKNLFAETTHPSYPHKFVALEDKFFFFANESNSTDTKELWVSDGTPEGTEFLYEWQNVVRPRILPADTLVYYALHDYALWRTDGTNEGTFMVKSMRADIVEFDGITIQDQLIFVDTALCGDTATVNCPELWVTDGSVAGTHTIIKMENAQEIIIRGNIGNNVMFTVRYYDTPAELWQTDGTVEGTIIIKTLEDIVQEHAIAGNYLYMRINNNLWRSDGTAAGTLILTEDIFSPHSFLVINNLLFFEKLGDLWQTDGTIAGTTIFSSDFYKALDFNEDILYFSTYSTINGWHLWRTDGTIIGTILVQSLPSDPDNSYMTDQILFMNLWNYPDLEIWRSDGSPSGTYNIATFPDPESDLSNIEFLNHSGSTVYFNFEEELWHSDGTSTGTISLTTSSIPIEKQLQFDGQLFFPMEDDAGDVELWHSDNTIKGTKLFKDLNVTSIIHSSNPSHLTDINGSLFFLTFPQGDSPDLWFSDGTAVGTYLLKENVININYDWNLTNANGTLYFSYNHELWKSDGTIDGTIRVTDQVSATKIVYYNNFIYFSTLNGEIWRSDGTDAGTSRALNQQFQHVYDLKPVGGQLFFIAADITHGDELWRTDGTTAGTGLIKDINPASDYSIYTSHIQELAPVGDKLFFTASDGVYRRLWITDGSEIGTYQIYDSNSEPYGPTLLTALSGIVYMSEAGQKALWRSDGSPSGTYIVKEIGGIEEITSLNETLFIAAIGKLWASDGTINGTISISKSNVHQLSWTMPMLTPFGNQIFFNATPQATGDSTLCSSDGTENGIDCYPSLNPDEHFDPQELAVIGDSLFFSAYDGVNGRELWKINLADAGAEINPSSLTLSEGGPTLSYAVSLLRPPTNNVVVTITGSDQVQLFPQKVTFTPENWNDMQTVQVSAVDDNVTEDIEVVEITHVASSIDSHYDNLIFESVMVTITDNFDLFMPLITVANNTVQLSWDAVDQATVYEIYRAMETPEFGSEPPFTMVTTTLWEDIGVLETIDAVFYRATAVTPTQSFQSRTLGAIKFDIRS